MNMAPRYTNLPMDLLDPANAGPIQMGQMLQLLQSLNAPANPFGRGIEPERRGPREVNHAAALLNADPAVMGEILAEFMPAAPTALSQPQTEMAVPPTRSIAPAGPPGLDTIGQNAVSADVIANSLQQKFAEQREAAALMEALGLNAGPAVAAPSAGAAPQGVNFIQQLADAFGENARWMGTDTAPAARVPSAIEPFDPQYGGRADPRFKTSDENLSLTNFLAAIANLPMMPGIIAGDYLKRYVGQPVRQFGADLLTPEGEVAARRAAEAAEAAKSTERLEGSPLGYRMPGAQAQMGPGGVVTIPLTPDSTVTPGTTVDRSRGIASGPSEGSVAVAGKDQTRLPSMVAADAAKEDDVAVTRVQLRPVDPETGMAESPPVLARPTNMRPGETYLDLTDDQWYTIEPDGDVRRAKVEEVDRVVAANPDIDPARAQLFRDSGRSLEPAPEGYIEPSSVEGTPVEDGERRAVFLDRDGVPNEIVPDPGRVDERGEPIPETEIAFEDESVEVDEDGRPLPPRAEAFEADLPPEQQAVDYPEAPQLPDPPDKEVAQMDEEAYKRRQFQLMIGQALAAAAAVPNEYGNVGQMIMALGGGLAGGTAQGLGERIEGRERFDSNRIETEYMNAFNDYQTMTGNTLRTFETESKEAESETGAANTNAANRYAVESQNAQNRFEAAQLNRQRTFEIMKTRWDAQQPQLINATDKNLVYKVTDPDTGVASIKIIPIAQQTQTALELLEMNRKLGADEEVARYSQYDYAKTVGDPVLYAQLMVDEAIKNGYAPEVFQELYTEILEEVKQQIAETHPNLGGSEDEQKLIDAAVSQRIGMVIMNQPAIIDKLIQAGNFGARMMEEIPGTPAAAPKGDRG